MHEMLVMTLVMLLLVAMGCRISNLDTPHTSHTHGFANRLDRLEPELELEGGTRGALAWRQNLIGHIVTSSYRRIEGTRSAHTQLSGACQTPVHSA